MDKKEILSVLSKTPLFKGLPEDQLQEIAQIALERLFKKGKIIFSEGDDGKGFFIVIRGKIKIFKVSSEGKEHILHIFGPGEPFGEVPVFSGQAFPANAEAIADSRLLFFPRFAFVELVSANPSLALNMLAVLSMRLRQFTVQIENLSLKEVPNRVAAYLIHLADEQGKQDAVRLNISKGQLAGLLGTIPETLSRTFAKMAGRNLIEVHGRNIRLIRRDKMETLAGN